MEVVEYRYDEALGGISMMSLVCMPAVESRFVCFGSEGLVCFDSERRIVKGVAIRANYEVPRIGYSIIFRPNEILKLVQRSMRDGFGSSIEHEDVVSTNKVYLIESYILQEPDPLFPNVDVGSWIVSYKIDDDAIWQMVKDNKLRGFSIEVNIDDSKLNSKYNNNIDLLNNCLFIYEETSA